MADPQERIFIAALGGLIAPLGMLAYRAGIPPGSFEPQSQKHDLPDVMMQAANEFIIRYLPSRWQQAVQSALKPGDSSPATWVQHAARLIENSGKLKADHLSRSRLKPILTTVTIKEAAPPGDWCLPITPLELTNRAAYPTAAAQLGGDAQAEYRGLWQGFIGELDKWKAVSGAAWEAQSEEAFYTTLLALLHKYLWCVPSGTAGQDVSLYDTARLTSALAACLAAGEASSAQTTENDPVALLVRGDLSGIQSFIYRINQPSAETEHIGKRLRGRSYYLTLLVEVVVAWILKRLNLPDTCAVYVGGGRFDLLLPVSASQALQQLQSELETWLLSAFQGELGIQLASVPASSADFADMRQVNTRLEQLLEHSKQQKWHSFLSDPAFFTPEENTWHVCRVCRLTPLPEPGTCSLCSLHEQIGQRLPYTTHLLFCQGRLRRSSKKNS